MMRSVVAAVGFPVAAVCFAVVPFLTWVDLLYANPLIFTQLGFAAAAWVVALVSVWCAPLAASTKWALSVLFTVSATVVCAGLGILLKANLTTGGGTNIGAGFFYLVGSGMCAVAALAAALTYVQTVLFHRRRRL